MDRPRPPHRSISRRVQTTSRPMGRRAARNHLSFYRRRNPEPGPRRITHERSHRTSLAEDAEFTVECNPDLVTFEQLTATGRQGSTASASAFSQWCPKYSPRSDETTTRTTSTPPPNKSDLQESQTLISISYTEPRAKAQKTGARASTSRHPSTHSTLSAYAPTVEPGTPLAEDSSRHPEDDDRRRNMS